MKLKIKFDLILIFVLILLVIYNNYVPFLNTNIRDSIRKKNEDEKIKIMKKEINDRINEIEEQSLIDVNKKLGGIDEVNADNLFTGINDRKTLVIQECDLGKSVIEEFDNYNFEEATLFKMEHCPASSQFTKLGLELQLKNILQGSKNMKLNVFKFTDNSSRQKVKEFCDNNEDICLKNANTNYPNYVDKDTKQVSKEDIGQYYQEKSIINKVNKLKQENENILTPFIIYKDVYISKMDLQNNSMMDVANKIASASTIEGFQGNTTTTTTFAECENEDKSKYFDHLTHRLKSIEKESQEMQGKKQITIDDEIKYMYDDVDSDGCVKASFEMCNYKDGVPGYKLFTNRGHYGCLKPDLSANLDSYSAAFSVVDSYLSSLPPEQDKETGKDKVYSRDCDENKKIKDEKRKALMKKCAAKYSNQITSFGLCNYKDKLISHANAISNINKGFAKSNFDLQPEEYERSADTAEAIKYICGINE